MANSHSPQRLSCRAVRHGQEETGISRLSSMARGRWRAIEHAPASSRFSSAAEEVRIWPPLASRVLCLLAILAGPIGVIGGLAFAYWIVALCSAFMPLLGARLVGWVEVHEDELRHRRLMGDSTIVRFSDVREVGLGLHHVGRTRWWYPELKLSSGESVKFLMLKSLSGRRTVARVEEIFAAAKHAMPDAPEDEFTSVTESSDGELEFFLSPGYDAFRRERAKATVETLKIETPIAQQPELFVVAASPEPPEPPVVQEDAPEVFVPGPLVEYKKSASTVALSLVPEPAHPVAVDETVSELGIIGRLVPPPIPQLIPVVIVQPNSDRRVADRGGDRRGPNRAFTSLFRREIDSQRSSSAA